MSANTNTERPIQKPAPSHLDRARTGGGLSSATRRAGDQSPEPTAGRHTHASSEDGRPPLSNPADLEGRSEAIRVAILLVNSSDLLANAVAVALNVDPGIHVVAVEVDPDVGPVRVAAARAAVALVDTVDLVSRLRVESPRLFVIILGDQSHPQAIVEAIRGGAAAFLDNRVSTNELAAVVKRVHAGELVYDLDDLLAVVDSPSLPPPSAPRRTARLSDRELAVLDAIATGATSKEAARRLGISLNTLRTHLKNIQVKLEARSKLEAVLIAIREGRIALPPDPD